MLAESDVCAGWGDRSRAITVADAAAKALRSGGWKVPLAWATLRQSDLAQDDATIDEHLTEAARLIPSLSLPSLRYGYLLRLGLQMKRRGRLDEAETALREAIGVVAELGAALPDQVLRAAFRSDRLAAHDALVGLLVDRGTPADLAAACRIGDLAKAQTLVDLLTGTLGSATPHRHDGVAPDPIDELREDLSATYVALMAAEGSSRRQLVLDRAKAIERQIGLVRLRAAASVPMATETQRTPERDGIGSAATGPRLSFHITGSDVIAFVTRDGEVRARRMSKAAPHVATELDRLAAQWSRFSLGSATLLRHERALRQTTVETLARLYGLLIGPVEHLLGDLDGQVLTVVPHRRLHQVPFHALHDGSGYVAERYATTLASSTPRAMVRTPAADRDQSGVLVFGVPDAGAPRVADELHRIAEIVDDATIVVGNAATSSLLSSHLPGPTVVHIACHGIYRGDNPLFSAIKLADRWMTAAEILDLDLRGALVILSACESGRHDSDTAEPVGLAWAFLAAGASSVVVSQWLVDDAAASELMPVFYRHLISDAAPAEALRQAQLSSLSAGTHPYYWAAFTHVTSPVLTTWSQQ